MTFATAVFGPGQPQVRPQHPQERAVAVHFQPDGFVVEFEGNRVSHAVLRFESTVR